MSRSRTASIDFQLRRQQQERAAAEARRAARIALRVDAERSAAQYVADRFAEADRHTRRLDERVQELRTLLARGLQRSPRQDPATRYRQVDPPALDLSGIGWQTPPPEWAQFAPPEPTALGRLLGRGARYRQELADARAAFDSARADHERAEAHRQHRFAEARRRYAARLASERRSVAEHNRAVDEFAAALRAREPAAVRRHLETVLAGVLAGVPQPRDFPRAADVACTRDAAVARVQLPGPDVVPAARAIRYDPAEDELRELPRPAEEIAELHRSVCGQVALLCVRDLLAADPGLESVTLHGQRAGATVLSLYADRAGFRRLDLGDVDGCLRRLAAPAQTARTA